MWLILWYAAELIFSRALHNAANFVSIVDRLNSARGTSPAIFLVLHNEELIIVLFFLKLDNLRKGAGRHADQVYEFLGPVIQIHKENKLLNVLWSKWT